MARHSHHHRRSLDKSHALKERDAAPKPNPATIVSVVYVTASPTFDGPVGGYTTIGTPISQPSRSSQRNDDRTTRESQRQTDSSDSTRQTSTSQSSRSMVSSTRSVQSTSATSSTASRATSSSSLTSASSQSTALVSSSIQSEPTTSAVFSSPTPSPAATGNSSSSQASGMSGSAKAGIALGVLLGLGLVLGLVCFLVRKKKRAAKEGYIDSDATSNSRLGGGEKFTPATDVQLEGRPSSVRTTHTVSTAPRLSLRPVTQFEPNLPGERKSAANLLAKEANGAAGATGAQQSTLAVPSPVAQPQGRSNSPTGSPKPEAQNPFGANAETMVSPTSTVTSPGTPGKSAAWPASTANPVEGNNGPMVDGAPTERRPSGPGIGAAVVAAATAASGANARPGVSTSDGTLAVAVNQNGAPASPVGSQASGGSGSVNGNNDAKTASTPVHRVVLDFSPTMDDELDLRIGQLVRVLHEYDDGWALCLRLDRSEQGVAPRACLSDNPVKPRPANGSPPGPGQMRSPPPPGWRPKQGGAPSPTAVVGRSLPSGPPPPGSPPGSPPGPRAMSPRPMSPVANNGRNSPGPYVAFHPQTSQAPAGYGRNSPVPRPASPYGGPARTASPAGVRPWQGAASPRSGTPPVGKGNSFNSVASAAGSSSAAGPRSGSGSGPGPVPARLPTVLRSGSPRPAGSPASPSSRSASPAPVRKPVPGQAL